MVRKAGGTGYSGQVIFLDNNAHHQHLSKEGRVKEKWEVRLM